MKQKLTGKKFIDGRAEPSVVLLVHLESLIESDDLGGLLLQLRLQPLDSVLRTSVSLLSLLGLTKT